MMSDLTLSLPVVWAAIIGIAVALYVVLDGFDLGIGILYPLFPDESDRDQMMNSVAPFWDGNETWLVLGGGGLWVAFPKAFAVIMPALYLPVMLLLLALIFRGVAFEFRWVAKPNHRAWDVAFAAASTTAAFAQGLVLGGLLQGIRVRNGQFAGYALDWLTPFSLACGVALVIGYALIGATWLVMKTDGHVEKRSRAVDQILQRLEHQGTDGDVGHELAVHHVDVDHPGSGVEDGLDVLAEAAEVRGQDRWRHVDAPQDVFHRSSDPSLPRHPPAAAVFYPAAAPTRRKRARKNPVDPAPGGRTSRKPPEAGCARPGQAVPRSSAVQPPAASSGSTTPSVSARVTVHTA
jgi:hypothetical protein